MNNDYLRYIAKELKDAGVDNITPDQLDDLAYHLDVSHVEKQLQKITNSDSFNELDQED